MPRAFAATAAVLVVRCGIPTLLDPAWLGTAVPGYAARVDALAAYATTYALAIQIAPSAWPLVAALLVAVALGACAFAVRAVDATTASHRCSLRRSSHGSPSRRTWPTDQVLLLAVALLALRSAERWTGAVRGAHLALTVLVITALPWTVFLISAPTPTQALGAIVPILRALLLAESARRARSAGPASPTIR